MTLFTMTEEQIQSLLDAWAYCDEEDKSTEFMLQYMSDMANVDYDDVVTWITSKAAAKARKEYYAARRKAQETLKKLNNPKS